MVQIAQVCGDENRGRMRPAADIGIPHGEHLTPGSLSPGEGPGCAGAHYGK
jgi:hypothetical protein